MENSISTLNYALETCSIPCDVLCRPLTTSMVKLLPPSPPITPPIKQKKVVGGESNLVHHLFAASSRPDKPLFVDLGGSSSCKVFSQAQFWDLVGKYAAVLAKLGMRKGDRVAAQVSKRVENVALYLGTVQMGGIFLPMNTDYTLDELLYFVNDAQPAIYIHQTGAVLPNKLTTVCCWITEDELFDRANVEQAEMYVQPVKEDDVAAILYTSGTTGKPKGAMLTHGNLVSNALSLRSMWRIEESDVMLHCLPIFHVHGLFVAINPLLLAGAKFLFLPRFDVDTVIKHLPSASVMMGVPTYYTRLMQSENFNKCLVKNMRLFTSGSAPLLECTWNKFRDITGGHEILERYGMTEGQMVCSNPYDGPRRPGTVGPPLKDVEVRVRNGMLEYRGPNVFLGYWNKPEKTAQEFTKDGFFKSGDLAHIDEDGYVHILGRGKDLIISGGLNVYPKEVEDVLDRIAGIKESAVIGVPDPDFGELVVAVIVPYTTLALTPADIIVECRKQLAGYKVPKRVHLVDKLARNTMGKVQKNKIRSELVGEEPLSCGFHVTYN